MYQVQLVKPDGRSLRLYSLQPISKEIVATNPPHEPIASAPHMRWHPLRGEWVAYASHRQNRTFLPPKDYSPLATTKSAEFPTEMPAGNYEVAVFENLFPSLEQSATIAPELIVPTSPANGVCEVVVFTQDSDTSLGQLSIDRVQLVLEVLGERTKEIGDRGHIQYVLPFENRGVEVGVTLHHPHGQIYAYPFVPAIPARQQQMMLEYFQKQGRGLLSDLLRDEKKDGRRIVHREGSATAFIPVCARYPYETWIMPERPVAYLHELTAGEMRDFAGCLKTMLMKFDQMWAKPFPYLMVIYQAPTDGRAHPESHLHIQFYPPYRTKDRLKFLAGTELGGGMFVNDSLPEEKAAELRSVEVK